MRLIDADSLTEPFLPFKGMSMSVKMFLIAVNNAKTVDAVPVVHGQWVYHPEIGWGSTWLCSECGEKTVETVMSEPRYKFCPMCGADVREDDEAHENH